MGKLWYCMLVLLWLVAGGCLSNCKGSGGGVGGGSSAPSATNVTAEYAFYITPQNNWSLIQAKVECAVYNGSAPYEWRSKYPWTAFCGPVGPRGEEACGKCLKVTNRGTGDKLTVRIVDECGMGGLILDHDTAFKKLDTDGEGEREGHLEVDYLFVDCKDDINPIPPTVAVQ